MQLHKANILFAQEKQDYIENKERIIDERASKKLQLRSVDFLSHTR